jgi:hypothetical protein
MKQVLIATILFTSVSLLFPQQIKVNSDEFTGKTTYSMEARHKISEGKKTVKFDANTLYSTTVGEGGKKTQLQLFLASVSEMDMRRGGFFPVFEQIDKRAYLSIDGEKIEIELNDLEREEKSMEWDAGSVSYGAGYAGGSITTYEKVIYSFAPTVTLDEFLEKRLSGAKKFLIRIYADDTPVTIDASKQLKHIKKFLKSAD